MELTSRIKEYFGFNSDEIKGIIIATFIIAFILSFREWGINKFDWIYGLKNLFNSAIIVALALLVRVSVEKIEALRRGYRLEWKMSFYGLLIGLILVFISNGLLFLLIPGGIVVYMIKRLRLGKLWYGLNRFEVALVALTGLLANVVLAILFKALMFVSASSLLHKAMVINVLLAVFSMLPIPPLEGFRIWIGSRLLYLFSLGLIGGCSVLLFLTNISTAVIGSLGVAVFIWLLYYIFFERFFS